MASEVDVGVKELGRLGVKKKRTSGHAQLMAGQDIRDVCSIESDGLAELTGIDPAKLLARLKTRIPDYEGELRETRERAFELADYRLTNEAADVIAEAMLATELMRQLVYEAGSHERALDLACRKYGLGRGDLKGGVGGGGLKVVELAGDSEVRRAWRLITGTYGASSSLRSESLLELTRIGSLLGVVDEGGSLAGTILLLRDMRGDSAIHSYSVAKGCRGLGVGSMLLDAAEEGAGGRVVWTGRSTTLIYNFRYLLDRGYVGRHYVRETFGDGSPIIFFEKRLDGGETQGGDRSGRVTVAAADGRALEEAMGAGGYCIVDCVQSGGEDDKLILGRIVGGGIFSPVIGEGCCSNEDVKNGFEPVRTAEDVEGVMKLARETGGGEVDYILLRIISYAGCPVIMKSGGRMRGFAGMMGDGGGRLYLYPVIAEAEDLPALLGYAGGYARRNGFKRVEYTHPMDDTVGLEAAFRAGYAGVKAYVNVLESGVSRMHLRFEAGWLDGLMREPADTAVVSRKSELDMKHAGVSVDAADYPLIEAALAGGYLAVSYSEGRMHFARELRKDL